MSQISRNQSPNLTVVDSIALPVKDRLNHWQLCQCQETDRKDDKKTNRQVNPYESIL